MMNIARPIPVAARSKAWVCADSLAGIVGSNPAGAWMSVCCECCVLSGRGLCDGLIARPQCVCVCPYVIRCNKKSLHLQRVGRRD